MTLSRIPNSEVVYRIRGLRKHHRDPGCRAFDRRFATLERFNAAIDAGLVELHVDEPDDSSRCFYCYSQAGLRRFPG